MRSNTQAPLSNRRLLTPRCRAALVLAALAFVALASGRASAQTETGAQRADDPAAPPPLRYIPDDVRRQLDAESRDVKERVKLSLQLAEDRLTRADAAAI